MKKNSKDGPSKFPWTTVVLIGAGAVVLWPVIQLIRNLAGTAGEIVDEVIDPIVEVVGDVVQGVIDGFTTVWRATAGVFDGTGRVTGISFNCLTAKNLMVAGDDFAKKCFFRRTSPNSRADKDGRSTVAALPDDYAAGVIMWLRTGARDYMYVNRDHAPLGPATLRLVNEFRESGTVYLKSNEPWAKFSKSQAALYSAALTGQLVARARAMGTPMTNELLAAYNLT